MKLTLRTQIILLIIVVITAAATIFAALYKPTRSDTIARPVIKIGAILPLSGNNAHVGLAAQNAINKMLEENAPNFRYKYQVIYDDVSLNVSNLQDVKATLLYTFAPEPQVNFTIGQNKFIMHSPHEEMLELFVKDLASRPIKNIGFITQNIGAYRELAKKFKEQLPTKYNLFAAIFQDNQKEFAPIINMLRNNDVELFVLIGAPYELDLLTQALHNAGVSNYQITSLASIDLSANPAFYNDIRYVGNNLGTYDENLSAQAIKTIINAYEANFKKDLLPSTNLVGKYIDQHQAQNGIIPVPVFLKKVKAGQIEEIKK